MADQRYPLELPVGGMLDTSGPISNRPPGTLVEAWDLASDAWGPRRGSQAFTRVWESAGTAALYDYVTFAGTNTARAFGRSVEDQYRDLGTTFTLDLWIRLEDWAYATGNDEVGIYAFSSNNGWISVGLYGDTQGANEKKLKVGITTTPTRGTSDATVTITGTNTLPSGTALTDLCHIRVVRNGATATVYLNGAQEGQSTSLSATSPINGSFGTPGDAIIGFSFTSDISFKGKILCAVLRDGAFSSAPITADFPANPWARNVHHYILGRNYDLGGVDHLFDAGRFSVNPKIISSVGSDYSVTSSNFDDFPVPAVVQGMRTWTTRSNRTATSVMAGGVMSTSIIS